LKHFLTLVGKETDRNRMKRCVYLTMGSLEGFVCDDELTREPLQKLGWTLSFADWREPGVDWNVFDVVVIRSTWDYQSNPGLFLERLEAIERSSALLYNSVETVRWNLRKSYLADLQDRGVPIVPTCWCSEVTEEKLAEPFESFDVPELVLKPLVGANADHAYRVSRGQVPALAARLRVAYGTSGYLAQPFVPSVVTEGEFSIFYFGGEFSHVILKTPKPHDFRVQEEHGGQISLARPEGALLEAGHRVIHSLPEIPLYGRVDLVRMDKDQFALMELELIEPSLYFRMDPGAAGRFVRILDCWHRESGLK
jgi:hypothetical protein